MERLLRFIALSITAVVMLSCAKLPGGKGRGEGSGDSGDRTPADVITLKRNTDWNITYLGREDREDSKVDVITVNRVPDGTAYMVCTVSQENYEQWDGDIKAFMENELKYAQDGDIFTVCPVSLEYNPLRHGKWYSFVIAVKNGKITGEYNWLLFEVQEETPSQDYLSWIGRWAVRDVNGLTFNVNISSLESNYIYRIDSWESYNGALAYRDEDYLEVYYEDGDLCFTSQYLVTWDNEYEDYFVGEFLYEGVTQPQGSYYYLEIGDALGWASYDKADKNRAVIEPSVVKAVFSEDEEYEATMYSMRYVFYTISLESWSKLNQKCTVFPITMERLRDNAVSPMGTGVEKATKPSSRRERLRGSIHGKIRGCGVNVIRQQALQER